MVDVVVSCTLSSYNLEWNALVVYTGKILFSLVAVISIEEALYTVEEKELSVNVCILSRAELERSMSIDITLVAGSAEGIYNFLKIIFLRIFDSFEVTIIIDLCRRCGRKKCQVYNILCLQQNI